MAIEMTGNERFGAGARVTPAQLRSARAMLSWTSERLASVARVHRRTIRKLEMGEATPQLETIHRIISTFELMGSNSLRAGLGSLPLLQVLHPSAL